MTKYILILSCLLALSCGVQKNTNPMDKITRENVASLINQDLPFSQIKINGNVKVDIPAKYLPGVSLTIYNEKGKKIWINGQVAIMNAGRMLATPEKLEAYEKLNKTYVSEDYNFVNQLLGVDFINYHSLEKLLLGKPFIPIDWRNSKVDISESQITIKADKPLIIELEDRKYAYFIDLTFDGQLNLQNVLLRDEASDRSVDIKYENRIEFQQMNLPQSVKIIIKDKKPMNITLNYNKFDDRQMDTPFSIPSNYKKRDIK